MICKVKQKRRIEGLLKKDKQMKAETDTVG